MGEREPITYDFTLREANLMGRACHKPTGQQYVTRGNVEVARRMEEAGLVTVTPDKEKFVMRPTVRGREAWQNYALRNAGRPLVRLTT